MKFQGTVAECLAQYAALLPPEGLKHRSRYYLPLIDFTGHRQGAIVRWLHKKDPQTPIGIPMLRAAFFFELLGGEVKELIDLKERSLLSYQLAELVAFGVVTVEDVTELLKYKGSNSNEVVGILCRRRNPSPERERLLRELIDDSAVEIAGRRQAANEKIRQQLRSLFRDDFFAEESAAGSDDLVSGNGFQKEPPAESMNQPAVAEAESDPVPPSREVADEVSVVTQEDGDLIEALGYQLLGLEQLMAFVASDRCTPKDRERLREITRRDGELPGETLFRISNLFTALSGEKGRTRVLVEEKQSQSKSKNQRSGQHV